MTDCSMLPLSGAIAECKRCLEQDDADLRTAVERVCGIAAEYIPSYKTGLKRFQQKGLDSHYATEEMRDDLITLLERWKPITRSSHTT